MSSAQTGGRWSEVGLAELADGRGKTIDPAKFPDRSFELYSIPAFPNGHPEVVSGHEVGSAKQCVVPRSVLLSKINPRINRVWVVGDHTPFDKVASTEWIVFRPREDLLPEFLCYCLQQEELRRYLAFNASGVGGSLMRVKTSTLNGWSISYPSTGEQARIVGEIETQFSRLDAAMAALKRAQANLKRCRASVLKAACEGRLVPTEAELARREGRSYETGAELLARVLEERRPCWNGRGKYVEPAGPETAGLAELPEGWAWATVDQLTSNVATGATPLRGKVDYWQDGTIPWVTSGALGGSLVTEAEECITPLALAQTNAKLFPSGTLLIALYGEGKTRGSVAELAFEAATNQACAALLFQGYNAALRPYLKQFLKSNYEAARRQASGGVQPNLSLGLVRRTNLPLPPLGEQERIVAEVERRLSAVEAAEQAVAAGLRRAARLRQAVLARAFSGEG